MTHGTTEIGLIVLFGVVLVPVYVMIAAWLVGRPRNYRPVAVTFGYVIVITVMMIVGMAVLGSVISLLIPY